MLTIMGCPTEDAGMFLSSTHKGGLLPGELFSDEIVVEKLKLGLI